MRRRLIAQRDSFTITIPKEWASSQHLSAGSEINLEEIENNLIISSSDFERKKECEIDVSNLSEITIRNGLNAIYVLSATKIIINSSKSSKLLLCKKLNSLFLFGFEITEERKNQIILEALATTPANNFDKFFLKLFDFTTYSLDLLEESTTNKNIDSFEEIKRITKNLTQYCNICNRLLLEQSINSTQKVASLEIISYLKEINHLIFHIFEKKVKMKATQIKLIKDMYLNIRQAYFKKDIESVNVMQTHFSTNSNELESNAHMFALSRNLYGLSNSILKIIF
jgi:phosphate uptake regulator